jgi:hypothetical protein
MSADGNTQIESSAEVAPTPGQAKFGSLYSGVLCGGLVFIFANGTWKPAHSHS